MRKLILAAATILLTIAPAGAAPDYEGLARSLTDEVVIPAYHRMAGRMSDLAIQAEAFCATPDRGRLEKLTNAYRSAMDAWQRAQPIAVGPVMEKGRTARIEYWPDRRGTGARQLRAALQERDPALIAEDGLAGKSVALQSLSAFERLLFDHAANLADGGAAMDDRYACNLAAAIARFQSRLATQILAEWMQPGGFREAMRTAGRGNAQFANAGEAATALLKGLVGSLDHIVRNKIESPLGKEMEDARPKRSESWRSERSLENIAANLMTIRDLYSSRNGFGDLLGAAGAKPLDVGMRKGFDGVVAMAQGIGKPMHVAVTEQEGRRKLTALLKELKSLRTLMSGSVAEEIGLVVGFNAQDGD